MLVERSKELYDTIVPEQRGYSLGRIPQSELSEDFVSMNKLTPTEKIEIAIAMAESLKDLHSLGVVHDDISIYQWMIDNRGTIVLNDLNLAEFLFVNGTRYCQYYTRFEGRFKAPEEYAGSFVDTSADVWAMGNLLYTLLMGKYIHLLIL